MSRALHASSALPYLSKIEAPVLGLYPSAGPITSDEQMKVWLTKLVGIERSFVFRLADGSEVRSITEEQHASQLTRPDVTAAVHYIRFEFTPEQVAAFGGDAGTVILAIDHPNYGEEIELLPATVAELRGDLLP